MVAVVGFASSQLVYIAVEQAALIPGAPFLTLLPILGLMWLKPKEEIVGWSLFTIWLSLTYLSSGEPMEFAATSLIVILAIYGGFFNAKVLPWVWFAHVAWDFVPRELIPAMQDLPVACLIFDGLIGAYLLWRLKKLELHLPPSSPFFKSADSSVVAN